MLTSKEIRESFKDFFESKGHKIVPSAPMVIKDDPTLMFTNAGMNQFKDVILGNAPIKYRRVADSQKCLRVSGKHNDLEEVGHDTYHHTMFEMLGNWSFGDYFKKEAIDWAWEYLTEVLKIDRDRLYVTVFEGSETDGLDRDNDAADFWAEHVAVDRIINGNKKDNFWEMGNTGPCGPCSEIHVDIRSNEERALVSGADLVNNDHPQVIEIWNLVFMQYNRKADGKLDSLPCRTIDTGMGFERLCMVLQGKKSSYDTDIFTPIISKISQLSGVRYGESQQDDVAMRVVADHIRTIAFSITDGQMPSNVKAGYVIRRILRRAVRYAYTFLNRKEPFLYLLLDPLIEVMGDAYPELITQKNFIEKVIRDEEESFLRTLESGIRVLEKHMADLKQHDERILSGKDAFHLYDTFGFPLDLTELILRENNFEIDEKGFDLEMQKQKNRGRRAAEIEAGDWVVLKDGESVFVGYDHEECETHILKYRQIKQKEQSFYQVILSETPFYSEMGGQVGDTGKLIDERGKSYEIFDTKRENNLTVHLMRQIPDTPEEKLLALLDVKRRRNIERNHTATHLLHEALREILGSHVEQRGSLVAPNILRFDFSHFEKIDDETIRKIERHVNDRIREDINLDEQRSIPIEKAKEMGAMALFGEKYGEEVRVIRFGSSLELCGGTHIASTGKIGCFRIITESSIAAGTRRIEALTGDKCDDYLYSIADALKNAKTLLNNPKQLDQAITSLISANNELQKQNGQLLEEKASSLRAEIISAEEQIGENKFFKLSGSYPSDVVKNIAFQLQREVGDHFVFIAATRYDGKPSLLVMTGKSNVSEQNNAVVFIRNVAKFIQGGGGGQQHFATAGGKNVEGLDKAYSTLEKEVKLYLYSVSHV